MAELYPAPDGAEAALITALAARLCHDLAGQLGTVGGMIALAREEPPGTEALALAAETASGMVARVRFLRAAWGGDAGPMDAAALAVLARGVPGGERLPVDFSGLHGTLPEEAARLVLCVLPVAVLAAGQGGALRISGDGAVLAARLAGDSWPAADFSGPRDVAAALLPLVAAACGYGMAISGDTLTLTRA